jgi:hypothetical protein
MLDNNPTALSIAADSSLYQRRADGTIWLYTGPPLTGWQTLDNNKATISITAS